MRQPTADVNRYLQVALTAGVLLSLAILAWGSLLLLMHRQNGPTPTSLGRAVEGTLSLDPTATISLGLLVLLITPAAGVAAIMLAFLIQRDRLYSFLALVVFIILALSAVFGR